MLGILRLLIEQLKTLPLLVFALTVLIQSHFGWRAVVLFLVLAAATWAVNGLATIQHVNASLNEIFAFRQQFPHIELRPVPVSEYLVVVRNVVPQLRSKRPDEIMPFMLGARHDRLRILIRTSHESPLPPTLVTFAMVGTSWSILADPPEVLNGIGHFLLLHEIGHSAFGSLAPKFMSSIGLRHVILSGIFLIFLAAPSPLQLVVLATMTLCWLYFASAERRHSCTIRRLFDEINADSFALERSDPTWFKRFATSDIVSAFSKLEGGSAFMSPEQRQIRTHAFSENLSRLIKEQLPLGAGAFVPLYKWSQVGDYLLIALMVILGLTHAQLNIWRLAIVTVLSLVAVCYSMLAFGIKSLEIELTDDLLGIKAIAPEKLRFLELSALKRKKLKHIANWIRHNAAHARSDVGVSEGSQG